MKKVLIAVFVCCLMGASFAQQSASNAHANGKLADAEKVRTLIRLSGAEANSRVMIEGILAQTKENVRKVFTSKDKNLPEPMLLEIDAVVAKFFEEVLPVEELIAQLVPVYQRHLTDQELDAAIAFFSSPAGRAFVEKTPTMSREGMAVGQAFARERVAARQQEFQSKLEAIVVKYMPNQAQPGK